MNHPLSRDNTFTQSFELEATIEPDPGYFGTELEITLNCSPGARSGLEYITVEFRLLQLPLVTPGLLSLEEMQRKRTLFSKYYRVQDVSQSPYESLLLIGLCNDRLSGDLALSTVGNFIVDHVFNHQSFELENWLPQYSYIVRKSDGR